MNINKIKKIFYFTVTTVLFSVTVSYSQTEGGKIGGMSSETYAYLFLAALLFTLAVLFASLMIFESAERKEKKIAKAVGIVENEKELLLKNHTYDGIMELDNKPPAWFKFLFYLTIVFAVIYMINFHLLKKNNLMIDEYIDEMTFAQQQREELSKTGALINENNVTFLTDDADIQKGKEIFTVNCINCHGPEGGGTVGPNLTDDYWIHGGGIKNVFATISNGVPAKGMITWKTQLSPKQMQQVASYVLTFKGTKPANPKAPEGPVWQEPDSTKTDTTINKK